MKTEPLFIPLPSAPHGSVLPSLQGKTLVSSAQGLLPCNWIPGSCIYCHVLSCAHVCMHIRSHQEGSKTLLCTNMFASYGALKMKPKMSKGYWIIIETKPMQDQCVKITHLQNTGSRYSSKFFFCFFFDRPHLSWKCVWPQRSTKVRAYKSL